MMEELQRYSVHTLVFRPLKRSQDMSFLSNQGLLPPVDDTAEKISKSVKKMQAMRQLQGIRGLRQFTSRI